MVVYHDQSSELAVHDCVSLGVRFQSCDPRSSNAAFLVAGEMAFEEETCSLTRRANQRREIASLFTGRQWPGAAALYVRGVIVR